jgi:electron transport complex protein RnfA
MNGIPLVLLIIFSALTMNLTLQCGLGIKGVAESKNCDKVSTVIKLSVIFISVILLWFVFSRLLFSIISGIYIYVLLFPVSYIVYEGLEFLVFHYILKNSSREEYFISFPGGITAVAVFICINIANSFLQAAVLSFGFTAGIILVFLIVREIRKRADIEAVPRFLQGKPLVLVTMGMLSLIFSAATLLILRMLDIK